jgi:thiol-disulfide isomerase/thioredoxin
MKKIVLAVSLLLFTSCAQTSINSDSNDTPAVKQVGEVIDCTEILQEKLPTGGTPLDCLDQSEGAQLGALRGPMIVNVWGSWCGPCVEEIPYFVSFYEKAKSSVQLVGVNFISLLVITQNFRYMYGCPFLLFLPAGERRHSLVCEAPGPEVQPLNTCTQTPQSRSRVEPAELSNKMC